MGRHTNSHTLNMRYVPLTMNPCSCANSKKSRAFLVDFIEDYKGCQHCTHDLDPIGINPLWLHYTVRGLRQTESDPDRSQSASGYGFDPDRS